MRAVSSPMRVSVVIVSWNALDLLKSFLPSVCASTYRDLEIVLADNASTDASVDWVRAHHPNVRVATFDRNHGYCGGNNRGAKAASGDILIFLNNDVRVEAGWIEPLAARFRSDPRIGILQPKIRSVRHPDRFEYAGAAGGYLDRYGYPFCKGRVFDQVEADHGQYDTAGPVFWASGAAFAIRRGVFEEAGGFDEDFEFHMEEIDLCWRAQRLGHDVWTEPASVVYHLGGGSLPMASPRKAYFNFRNNLAMLVKNLPANRLLPVWVMRSMLDELAMTRSLAKGDVRTFAAIWKAIIVALFAIPKHAQKRLPAHRVVREPALAPFSVVWQHFARKRRTFTELPTFAP